jgi:uncharacterized protein YprB with RNaseH-like and TPR domain
MWQQNVGLPQLIDSGYVLCWAAKWLGDADIMFDSIKRSGPKKMLQRIHRLLDSADAVIHYNGTKFDIPTLNKEFLIYGMEPPAPYQQIDLLKTARTKFRFPSNKLDYVAKALGVKRKVQHRGHDLWIKCMEKDADAWKEMEVYNKGDIDTLEGVYYKFRPWIRGHANHSVFRGDLVCPTCGGTHYQRRGYHVTRAGKYQKFQCSDCGSWFRHNKTEAATEKFLDL